MKRPLVVLALAWTLGVVLAGLVPWVGNLLFLILIPLLLGIGYRQVHPLKDQKALWWPAILAVSLLGFLRAGELRDSYRQNLREFQSLAEANPVVLSGRVSTEPQGQGDLWRVSLDAPSILIPFQSGVLSGSVDLWETSTERPPYKYGDILHATGNLKPYSGRYAEKRDGIAHWHESRGALGSMFIAVPESTTSTTSELSLADSILRWRDRWKDVVRQWVRGHLSGDPAELVLTLTVGDRAGLSPELRESLTRSGLLHLISISGLHVTSLILTLPWIFKVFGLKRKARAALAVCLAFMLLVLVGASPPVLRSVIMGICLLLGILLDRPRDTLNFLGGACFLDLVLNPSDVYSPGFQFSFLVVAALLLWGPSFSRIDPSLTKIFSVMDLIPPTHWFNRLALRTTRWMASALWTSWIAVLAAAPVSLYHFHQISIGALFGNLVAIPLTVGVTLLGMVLTFGFWMVPILSDLLLTPLGFMTDLLIRSIFWTDSWQGFLYRVSGFHPLQAVVPIAILLLVRQEQVWLSEKGISKKSLGLTLLFVLALLPWTPRPKAFRVTFLDVGQGDSILLEFPAGTRLLVDSGPPQSTAPGNVSPLGALLLKRGIDRLDGVFVTHPESDHYGGFIQLVEEIPIERVYCSGDSNTSAEFLRFVKAVERKEIPFERVLRGDALSGIRDATVTVLSPFAEDLVYGLGNRNERSVVLLVDVMGMKTLLPGDIGDPQENKLVEGLLPDVDLLKIPHHGSRFSSSESFLTQTRPEIAVIQCGRNTHGHPAPTVLDRLANLGISVFTTLHDGTVAMTWNGKKLLIETQE